MRSLFQQNFHQLVATLLITDTVPKLWLVWLTEHSAQTLPDLITQQKEYYSIQ